MHVHVNKQNSTICSRGRVELEIGQLPIIKFSLITMRHDQGKFQILDFNRVVTKARAAICIVASTTANFSE